MSIEYNRIDHVLGTSYGGSCTLRTAIWRTDNWTLAYTRSRKRAAGRADC